MEMSKQRVRVFAEQFELPDSPPSNIRMYGTTRVIKRTIHFITEEGGKRKGRCYRWDSYSQVLSCFEVYYDASEGLWQVGKILTKHRSEQPTKSEMIEKLEFLK